MTPFPKNRRSRGIWTTTRRLGCADRWCERRDSNPQATRRWILSPVRLPIPPLSLLDSVLSAVKPHNRSVGTVSRKSSQGIVGKPAQRLPAKGCLRLRGMGIAAIGRSLVPPCAVKKPHQSRQGMPGSGRVGIDLGPENTKLEKSLQLELEMRSAGGYIIIGENRAPALSLATPISASRECRAAVGRDSGITRSRLEKEVDHDGLSA